MATAGPKTLLVGLRNKGMPYTRHSIGGDLLWYMGDRLGVTWSSDRDCRSQVAETQSLILCLPNTLMNISGPPVNKTMKKFGIAKENLVVLHDDLDRSFGKCSWKNGGSASGHNGVRSIIDSLRTDAFRRVRLGIGRPESRMMVTPYVLGPFSAQERERLETELYDYYARTILSELGAAPELGVFALKKKRSRAVEIEEDPKASRPVQAAKVEEPSSYQCTLS